MCWLRTEPEQGSDRSGLGPGKRFPHRYGLRRYRIPPQGSRYRRRRRWWRRWWCTHLWRRSKRNRKWKSEPEMGSGPEVIVSSIITKEVATQELKKTRRGNFVSSVIFVRDLIKSNFHYVEIISFSDSSPICFDLFGSFQSIYMILSLSSLGSENAYYIVGQWAVMAGFSRFLWNASTDFENWFLQKNYDSIKKQRERIVTFGKMTSSHQQKTTLFFFVRPKGSI